MSPLARHPIHWRCRRVKPQTMHSCGSAIATYSPYPSQPERQSTVVVRHGLAVCCILTSTNFVENMGSAKERGSRKFEKQTASMPDSLSNMMSYPNITFSVILPNYNNGGTLGRAIDSLLAQSCPAHEIIVIDDGSSDDSGEVAARYGSRIIYVYQQNAGVSAARNLGARLATGTWLAFLDADDTFFPNRLEAHVAWIAREPGIEFLLADQEFRDPDDKLLQYAISGSAAGRELVARHPGQVDIPLAAHDFEMMVRDGFAEIRTLSLPRARFLTLGGFPLNQKIGEDLHFFVRLLMGSTRGGVVNLPLAIYYIYPSSALRKEPVAAQRAFVAMLEALMAEIGTASAGIRRGVFAKLRQARLSLAYIYLREGQRRSALAAVAPMLLRAPSLIALRDVASVLRGLP